MEPILGTMTSPVGTQPIPKRKLIEVSLPLEVINRESAREKSIRHGHPSTLHMWWARRPLAAARAVLFAQLVDDPSSLPREFPTEELQAKERERLHEIIRKLVVWENAGDEGLLREAHQEILKSTDGNPPAIIDPFAGGGAIPLEAQRLGLEAHASDLNPVAVLINKALIDIPPRFADRAPVFPGAADDRLGHWPRATGLAEDIRRYGAWMLDRAQERIGDLYPKVEITDPTTSSKSEATVIAWVWARTITCPNPACGIKMPLVRSWWLSKRKGKEAYVVPSVVADPSAPSGRRVKFSIGNDPHSAPSKADDGTMVIGRGANCLACGSFTPLAAIREQGKSGHIDAALMATVAEGRRQRIYVAPDQRHESAADVLIPRSVPSGSIAENPRWFSPPGYGFTEFSDLFTNRQLVALTTLSDLVSEARERVLTDALVAGHLENERLAEGGTGAAAYADAVSTYLGMGMSKATNTTSSITTWMNDRGAFRETFARQALPMSWDYAESNILGASGGSLSTIFDKEAKVVDALPATKPAGVLQADAASLDFSNAVISTDPPYYDNIGYSDLSDFFYVWLRRALQPIHPDVFATMLVPKTEELVANPYRHGGREGASNFFEEGFARIFANARKTASNNYPITVFYAFKQAEASDEGIASTGWATLLEGMIRSGWSITATWPMRTEGSGRLLAKGTNALASSIVLSLRPRADAAVGTNRRGFLTALKAELPTALKDMQQGAIAPVDLAQATIGPGMAVFSRFSRVLESDGSPMSVKTALALINQSLDEVLSEQDGDLDADSRFCVDWYKQYAWEEKDYGEAHTLAQAKNTSVDGLARGGVIASKAGKVRLISPADLNPEWNPLTDDRVSIWEATCHLARSYANEGSDATARLMAAIGKRVDLDAVQLLAYRLYEISQDKRPQDALLFNGLGTSWSDLTLAARSLPLEAIQAGFDFDSEN